MPKIQTYYRNRTRWEAAQSFMDLLYVSIVRNFRSETGGAVLGILIAFLRPLLLVAMFYIFYEALGVRGSMVRGNFIIFMLTGIFLYLNHIQAVSKIKGLSFASSGITFYAVTSSLLVVLARSLKELYVLVVSCLIITLVGHLILGDLELYRPAYLILPFFLAWFSGLAVGMLFIAFTPFAPGIVPMLFMFYRRAQMIASGKMLLGNMVPLALLPYFEWNPLFHAIDQARGYAFINYVPHNSDLMLALYISVGALVLGMVVEFSHRIRQTRGVE